MARRAQRARYYANAAYVRRRRRQAAAQWLALSTELGAPNRPVSGGGNGLPVPDSQTVYIPADVAYTDVATNRIIVDGLIRGRFGNNSVFGSGSRILVSGGIQYDIAGSVGSGGLR